VLRLRRARRLRRPDTGGTVTLTAIAVVGAPELSVATAVRVAAPIAVGVQPHEYGAVASLQPGMSTPFARNTTWLIEPSVSPASAVIVCAVLTTTLAPPAGVVIETVGGALTGVADQPPRNLLRTEMLLTRQLVLDVVP
jgi:hypothetical protein